MIVLRVIYALLAIACLITSTYIIVFYHLFDSNRDAMDDYSMAAAIIFTVLFSVFFKLAGG